MKRLTICKLFVMIMACVIFIGGLPNQSYADGNVFDCIENDKDCAENNAPITESDEDNTDKAPVSTSAWDYVKTLLALVFVIGLLFALLKFVNRKNRLYDKNRLMKNMGGISLGQHKSVQLVVVGESYYLIGVGEDIRLLKEITDKDEIEKLIEFYGEDHVDTGMGWLDRLLAMKKQPKKENNQTTDFSNVFNTRLDEMKEERQRHIRQLTEKERDKDE